MELVALPPAIGLTIAAVIGILKYLGFVKDGNGGKLATALSLLCAAVLTILVDVYGVVDLDSELSQTILQCLGYLANLVLTLLGSLLTHKTSKQLQLYLPRNR